MLVEYRQLILPILLIINNFSNNNNKNKIKRRKKYLLLSIKVAPKQSIKNSK